MIGLIMSYVLALPGSLLVIFLHKHISNPWYMCVHAISIVLLVTLLMCVFIYASKAAMESDSVTGNVSCADMLVMRSVIVIIAVLVYITLFYIFGFYIPSLLFASCSFILTLFRPRISFARVYVCYSVVSLLIAVITILVLSVRA